MNPLTDSAPWVESPFFEQFLAEKDLGPDLSNLARGYSQDGYVVLDDVLDEAGCAGIVEDVASLYQDDVAEGPRSRYRVQDAWRECPSVKALASHPRILEVLETFYGRRPIPFQTLNFRYGTQQPAHADSLHFHCMPRGFMCGVWVALEEMTPDNGPLAYYPGSHRLPDVEYLGIDPSRFVEHQAAYLRRLEARYEEREFTAARGQALVWAANLWHGGKPIRREGATRHSQVTHYFFEDCVYFQPQNSQVALGRYALRDVTDIGTGEVVPHRYNEVDLDPVDSGDGAFWLRPRAN